jgi:hypothetical protein
MKLLFSIFTLSLISSNCFSQSLEGEWKGSFTYYFTDPKTPYYTYQTNNKPIKVIIALNADSTYSGFSYSTGPDFRGNDTTYVCALLCKRISSDSVYLEEMKLIKPNNVSSNCGQKMYLKFGKRKRSITLEGKWKTNPKCAEDYSGEITLYKKISD